MKKEEEFIKVSSDTELYSVRFIPDLETDIIGIIQFHHGMMEHLMRYENLARFLTDNGFVFCTYDCRGHGRTAQRQYDGKKEFNHLKNNEGYAVKLGDKNGFNLCVQDLNDIILENKKRFPNKKTILLGYSFGSFVAQSYLYQFGKNIQGCILCGSKGPEPVKEVLTGFILKTICLFAPDSRADFLEDLPIKYIYLKPYKKPYSNKLIWMCSDQTVVQDYINDPFCFNGITNSYIKDLMNGTFDMNRKSNLKRIPKEVPVLFIQGSEDPIGGYGKNLRKLFRLYDKTGITYTSITYNGCRHEILKDVEYKKVWNDIIDFAIHVFNEE